MEVEVRGYSMVLRGRGGNELAPGQNPLCTEYTPLQHGNRCAGHQQGKEEKTFNPSIHSQST